MEGAGHVSAPLHSDMERLKSRDPYWDNMKAICVLLVVICHTSAIGSAALLPGADMTDGNPDSEQMRKMREAIIQHVGVTPSAVGIGCFLVLAPVVMPGFSFASGHLSRSYSTLTPKRIQNLVQGLMVVAIFQLVSAAMKLGMEKKGKFELWGAVGVHWFLFCLVVWRALLPFLTMLRRPLLLSVSLGTLTVVTDATNVYFRTCLTFLPFFVAGFQTQPETLKKWRTPLVRSCFVATLVLTCTVCALVLKSSSMFKLEDPYSCFYYAAPACYAWTSIPVHLSFYLISPLLICGFFALIPETHVWGLTFAGQTSLYIYLLHIYLLLPFTLISTSVSGWAWLGTAVAYSTCVWALLGTGCARPCCWPCVEPNSGCCLKPPVQCDETKEEPVASMPPPQQVLSV